MIVHKLSKEDGLELLEIGKRFHAETRYQGKPLSLEAIWRMMGTIDTYPDKYFIALYKVNGKIVGFFAGQISLEFFTGNQVASDLGIYVLPEFRGTRVFLRLLNEFELWAKARGASKIILYHSTGIEPEKSSQMFQKLGYEKYGYIFDKEI